MSRRDNTLQVQVELVAPKGATRKRGALVVLSGPRPGMVIAIPDESVTIGRSSEANVAIEDESLSRTHARFFHAHGQWFAQDLGSTNGTFVDGVRLAEPVSLQDGARIQLGGSLLLRYRLSDEAELEAARRSFEVSVRDALTGLHNRHFLDERLAAEMSFAARHATLLSVIFVDADHFKRVNDTYGHLGGDEVLRKLSALLLKSMRSEDLVARYGGEEFVLVLRGIDKPGAIAVAERVRRDVEASPIAFEGAAIPMTVSVGAATFSPTRRFESAAEILAVADAALYRAKSGGRNRVEFAD